MIVRSQNTNLVRNESNLHLQERNRGGNSVGKVSRRGHLFNAFADQDFTFSPLELANYQGLRVKNFNFTSTLRGPNATLTVMAYMFQDEGNITFGNETSEMRKGMLKFNIQVERGIVNRDSINS